MSVTIFNHGGGGVGELAISVVGGTVQPTGVSGLIWINTAVTINKWTASVAEPSSPATGDVWMQTDGASSNIIRLLKKTGAVANINVLRVKQYNGTAWVSRAAYYFTDIWYQISNTFNPATDITYTGASTLIDDGSGHWRMKLLTSGVLTFLQAPATTVDLFIAGGGAGGAGGVGTNHNFSGGGGGGGYTRTQLAISGIQASTPYSIVIGAGGAGSAPQASTFAPNNPGGASSAFGFSASGGASINGGSGGGCQMFQGVGGSGASNGGMAANQISGAGTHYGGTGQGTTTKEFGETTGALYCGGGGGGTAGSGAGAVGGAGGGANGGADSVSGSSASANTGGGGGGGGTYSGAGGNGGSGIVVIRDHR